jgi:hypothetical protein
MMPSESKSPITKESATTRLSSLLTKFSSPASPKSDVAGGPNPKAARLPDSAISKNYQAIQSKQKKLGNKSKKRKQEKKERTTEPAKPEERKPAVS